MSLLYIDGFDTYGSTDGQNVFDAMNEAGWIGQAGFAPQPNPEVYDDTRTGIGRSFTPSNWTYGGEMKRAFPTVSGVVCGFAVKLLTSQFQMLAAFSYNNYVGTIVRQMALYANGSNGITVMSGAGVYASSPNVLFEGVWQYIEIKYAPGNGTSYLEVRVDGVSVITVTNEALMAAGSASLVNMVEFAGERKINLFDDLYICSTAGATFNDFLGDCVVHPMLPVADGGVNMLDQHGGITGQHFTCINNVPPDDDASYLSGDTAGLRESYTLGSLPADVVQVLAVSINTTARKTNPGMGVYHSYLKTGGVEVDSPVYSAPIVYLQTQFVLETPPGGGAWTNSALTNAEIGFYLP